MLSTNQEWINWIAFAEQVIESSSDVKHAQSGNEGGIPNRTATIH